jgi:hypothetical protein
VLFRRRPAYRDTAKHSIYVHHELLREGISRLLLPALIDACAAAGFRQMIGHIDSANACVSLALHKNFGFRTVGQLVSVGFRFGRWSDNIMVQRFLGPGEIRRPTASTPLIPANDASSFASVERSSNEHWIALLAMSRRSVLAKAIRRLVQFLAMKHRQLWVLTFFWKYEHCGRSIDLSEYK